MAWIRTIEQGDAQGQLAELYRTMVEPKSGRVDNVMKVHSLHPEGLKAHGAVYAAAMTGTQTFRKVDREMIALVVSKLNGCHY